MSIGKSSPWLIHAARVHGALTVKQGAAQPQSLTSKSNVNFKLPKGMWLSAGLKISGEEYD